MNNQIDWKKYLIVFIITLGLFGIASFLSSYFTGKKINQLKNIENNISIDLISSEVQFSLLQDLSCKDISNTVLSSELNTIAEKITYSEDNIGTKNTDVINLKKSYSLLQIKDYLLMRKITERCGEKSVFVLYFYGDDTCADCAKQSFALTKMRETYPKLRVYSFDYNLDLSAIKTMISIYKIPNNLPAVVVNGKIYTGLQSIEEIESKIPEIEVWKKEMEKARLEEEKLREQAEKENISIKTTKQEKK